MFAPGSSTHPVTHLWLDSTRSSARRILEFVTRLKPEFGSAAAPST
jgi:hypothetical protein